MVDKTGAGSLMARVLVPQFIEAAVKGGSWPSPLIPFGRLAPKTAFKLLRQLKRGLKTEKGSRFIIIKIIKCGV